MKKLVIIFLALFVTTCGFSQDDEFQTIFGDDEFSISGFGGPFMSFNTVAGEFAHMMGGGGGIILNNKIIFGGYGLGKTTRIGLDSTRFDNAEFADRYLFGNENKIPNLEIDYGHGGLFAGYVMNGKSAFHPTFMVQFGWGSVDVTDTPGLSDYTDNIFVLNPVLELEMNVTQFFRVGIGANYTMVTGVSLEGYKNSDFSSPGAFLSFKFGWF